MTTLGFGANLPSANMNTAQSIRRAENSRASFVTRLLVCTVLVTGCGGQVEVETSVDGSASALGGSGSALDGSASTTVQDTCSSDSDCTFCRFGTRPTDSSQCDTGQACCFGIPMVQNRCDEYQTAWNLYCQTQITNFIVCPCPDMSCSVACTDGTCTESCGVP